HCMGAACLSIAIARGSLGEKTRLTHVVLSTIGLFYEVAVDGRLKASDRVLERLLSREEIYFVDPVCNPRDVGSDPHEDSDDVLGTKWPNELEKMYEAWPHWWRPHRQANGALTSHILSMCNRLSFMYGEPYHEPALCAQIHE